MATTTTAGSGRALARRRHRIADSESEDNDAEPSARHRILPSSPSSDEIGADATAPVVSLLSSDDDDDDSDDAPLLTTPQRPLASTTRPRDPASSVIRRLSSRRILSSSSSEDAAAEDDDGDDVPIRSQRRRRICGRRLVLSGGDSSGGAESADDRPVRQLNSAAGRRLPSPSSSSSPPRGATPSSSTTSSEAPMSDFIVDDDDVVMRSSSDSDDDESEAEFCHRAVLFEQEGRGPRPGRPSAAGLSVDDAYGVFFGVLTDLCTGRAVTVGEAERAASEKVLDHLHARMNNFVLSGSWSRDFLADIRTAPCLSESAGATWLFAPCEVCRRPDRPSSARLHFKGPRYRAERATLFEIAKRPNISLLLDAADSDGPSSYNVGRFCRSRVVLYHRMAHYLLHTAVALRTKWGRLSQHDPGSARDALLKLEPEFHCGYEELLDWADRYAVQDRGPTSLEIEFSTDVERLRPSDAEVIRWVPQLFSRSGQFP